MGKFRGRLILKKVIIKPQLFDVRKKYPALALVSPAEADVCVCVYVSKKEKSTRRPRKLRS